MDHESSVILCILEWLTQPDSSCSLQADRLDLLSRLQQLPLKVRTEEQEAILQGLSPAETGEPADTLSLHQSDVPC